MWSLLCQVMGWVNQCHDTLRDLGIEEDELGFPRGSDRGTGMLTDKYINRMQQQLNAWCTNILQVPAQEQVICACLLPALGFVLSLHCLLTSFDRVAVLVTHCPRGTGARAMASREWVCVCVCVLMLMANSWSTDVVWMTA